MIPDPRIDRFARNWVGILENEDSERVEVFAGEDQLYEGKLKWSRTVI